jgi:hypothetical protein
VCYLRLAFGRMIISAALTGGRFLKAIYRCRYNVCLRQNVRDIAQKAHSLSHTSGVLRRIGAIAVGMTSKDGGQLSKMKTKLSMSMTLAQFDNGYWYAAELKDFAETIGIQSLLRPGDDQDLFRFYAETTCEQASQLWLSLGWTKPESLG